MKTLSDELTEILGNLDVTKDPRRVASGALLLEEVQRHEAERERLTKRVRDYVANKGSAQNGNPQSLADWAESVLRDADGPMPYREIAAVIRSRGFEHSRQPKNPEQLRDSVWSAMFEDDRFVKVGRGIWDLASRQNNGSH
jgi:hypothetical protein